MYERNFWPTVAKNFNFSKLMHNNEPSDLVCYCYFLFHFVVLFREKSLILLGYLYARFNDSAGGWHKKPITKFNRFNSNFVYSLIVIYLQHKTNLNIFFFSFVFVAGVYENSKYKSFNHIDLLNSKLNRSGANKNNHHHQFVRFILNRGKYRRLNSS